MSRHAAARHSHKYSRMADILHKNGTRRDPKHCGCRGDIHPVLTCGGAR